MQGLAAFSLAGRRALVTGASRGIGRALAEGLAAAGADVAVSGRDRATLQPVVAAIEAMGRRAVAIEMDVASAAACARGVAEAAAALGGHQQCRHGAGPPLDRR